MDHLDLGLASSRGLLADRYRIERRLGDDAVAPAYLAEDLRHRRRVALSLVREEVAGALDVETFLRELEPVAALHHARILPLYDCGWTKDGQLFLVNRLPEGESLRARLDRDRALPLALVRRVAWDVADALAFALTHGVVHGALSPDRVFFLGDRVEVDGFGIAQAMAASRTAGRLPNPAPAYTSPERLLAPPVLDARGDQYSLACILYEALAGQQPFAGPTVEALAGQHLLAEPAPVTAHRPGVPAELAAAIARAMAKSPAERFATVAELIDVVERSRELITTPAGTAVPLRAPPGVVPMMSPPTPGAPPRPASTTTPATPATSSLRVVIPARPEEEEQRHARAAFRTIRSRRAAMIGGGVVLALAAAGVLVAVPGASGALGAVGRTVADLAGRLRPAAAAGALDPQLVVAVLPFENKTADPAATWLAAGATEQVASLLARLPSIRVVSGSASASYRGAPDAPARMASELGVGSVVQGIIVADGGRVRLDLRVVDAKTSAELWIIGYDEPVEKLFDVQRRAALGVARALGAPVGPAEAKREARPPTTSLEAYELYMRARAVPSGTPEHNEEAVQMLRMAVGLDTTFAAAYAELGTRYFARAAGHASAGPAMADSALAFARRAVTVDPDLPRARATLGALQLRMGQLGAARQTWIQALELDPSSYVALTGLAMAGEALGRYDESLRFATTALALLPDGYSHYLAALALWRLDPEAGERLVRAAAAKFPEDRQLAHLASLVDAVRGRDTVALARARARATDGRGRVELAEVAALAGARDAVALLEPIARSAPGLRGTLLPESFGALYGLALAKAGDRARAQALWSQALAGAKATLDGGGEGPAAPMEIAAITAARGDTSGALAWLERAYLAGFRDASTLERDPFFADLRTNGRFGDLVQRMRDDVSLQARRAEAESEALLGMVGRR